MPIFIAAASPSPAATPAKTNNFLIPNGTFIAEMIIFLIILFVIGKYVVPFVNQKLAERQEAIRLEFKELESAYQARSDRSRVSRADRDCTG